MTRDQLLTEIRQALGANPRLSEMITSYAKTRADEELRRTYNQTEEKGLVYLTSFAHGIEKFATEITTPFKTTQRPGTERNAKD